jgi:thiol:disulfide interchange protein DsbD
VVDYGYRESVLLPVEVQTSGTALAAGSTLTFSAEVSWLVCQDSCVPGKAELTLALPVRLGPGPASAAHALFQAARSRLPRPMPPAWSAEAVSEKEFFVLTIHGAGVGKASFFPLEADRIDHAAPQTATALPGGVRLTLKKSDQLTRTPARLDGVLELGSGGAYAVSAPMRALSEQPAEP